MLVVSFKQLRLFCDLYICCFVQVFKVVLMLVFSFKQLRLFASPTLVVLFKCLKSSLCLSFPSSS